MTSTGSVSKRAANLQGLVLTALFAATLLLMGFTPLGLIDLPFMRATTLHIPVIIASVLLGPGRGGFLGGMFGLISLWKGTMAPNLVSFAFSPFVPLPGETHGTPWALVICSVPRSLVGVLPWFLEKLFQRLPGSRAAGKTVGYTAAGAVGSAVNTVLVMGLIGLLLGDAYAAAQGIGRDMINGFILTTILANGIPEAIAAAVITPAVRVGLDKVLSTIHTKRGTH